MQIIATLIDSDLTVEAVLRKTWKVNKRRPRRHWRRKGAFRTLCGRWAKDVILAKVGAKYPLDRSNCQACSNVEMALMVRTFDMTYKKMQRGEATIEEAKAEFIASRESQRHS